MEAQNFERAITGYHTIGVYCAVIAAVFLSVTLLLFFVFKIPGVLRKLTGRGAKCAMKKMSMAVFLVSFGIIFECSVVQAKEVSEKSQAESVCEVIYGRDEAGNDVKSVAFEFCVSEGDLSRYEVKAETNTGKLKEVKVDEIVLVKEPGKNSYCLRGKVYFRVTDVTKEKEYFSIHLICFHKKPHTSVHEEAERNLKICVKKKKIAIDSITYSKDQEYAGQDYTEAEEVVYITAAGVEEEDQSEVYVNTEGLQFDGPDAGVHSLKKEGLVLLGKAAHKYELLYDNLQDVKFQGRITEKVLWIEPDIRMEKEYYEENPEESRIWELAGGHCGGIVEGEEEEVKEALLKYHPRFKITAEKESPMFDAAGNEFLYEIIAYNPEETKKPEELKNYTFHLSVTDSEGKEQGTKVGELRILPGCVQDSDVCVLEDHIRKVNEHTVYIKKAGSVKGIVCPVKSDKYNDIVYVAGGENGEIYFNPDKESAGPVEDGTLGYKLVRREKNGAVTAESKVRELRFWIDDEAAVKVTVEAAEPEKSVFGKPSDGLALKMFGNRNTVKAKVDYEDVEAGIKEQYYQVFTYDHLPRGKSELIDYLERYDWETYARKVEVKNPVRNESVPISFKDGCFVVAAKVVDRVGNVQYGVSDGIVIDSLKPKAPRAEIEHPHPAGIYNNEIAVRISHLTDEERQYPDIFSGIKSVNYEVRLNAQNEPYTKGKICEREIISDGICNLDALRKKSAGQEGATLLIPLKKDRLSSRPEEKNDMKLILTATDYAGNSSKEMSLVFVFDIAPPAVTVDFGEAEPSNGCYFKENRTAKIQVTDASFESASVNFGNSNFTSREGWKKTEGSSATYETFLRYEQEGVCTFTFEVEDLAGNRSGMDTVGQNLPGYHKNFVIDKSMPSVQISYDNMEALSDRYYKKERMAVITVMDRNFYPEGVNAAVTAQKEGVKIVPPVLSGWESSGDIHTAKICFEEDGEYTFSLVCEDLAGNLTAGDETDYFCIDTTRPLLEISGVTDNSAYNGMVAPKVRISDTNFVPERVEILLEGAARGKIDIDHMVTQENAVSGENLLFDNFPPAMDDIYCLTVEATDKAGNKTMGKVTFSVNREGSTYLFDETTRKILEEGFTNTAPNLVIQEINVDRLETINLTCSREGEIRELKEGLDYTVQREEEKEKWKRYTYTIPANCFREEGAYLLNIYSEDCAMNRNTNQAKKQTLEFVVDRTKPLIAVSNLNDHGRYKEKKHVFTFQVKDNTALASAVLYLDGKPMARYTREELEKEEGKLQIQVKEKGEYQKIKIAAVDCAGNKVETMEYTILVTANDWIRFYKSKPIFCVGILAAVVSGVFVLMFIKYKKRKVL